MHLVDGWYLVLNDSKKEKKPLWRRHAHALPENNVMKFNIAAFKMSRLLQNPKH